MAKQAETIGEGYGGLAVGPIDHAAMSQAYKATGRAMAECMGVRVRPPEPVKVEPASDKPKPAMPTFKRPWWLRKKYIDIQPLLWSIEHRPKEWTISTHGLRFIHTNSKHEISVSRKGYYGITSDTSCDCSHSQAYFSGRQQSQFHKVFRAWLVANYSQLDSSARRRHRLEPRGHQLDAQFAEHFK